jgi:hypothetical protein
VRAQVTTWQQSLLDYVDGEIDGKYTKAQVQRATARLTAKIAEAEATLAAHTDRSPLQTLVGADDVRAAWDALPLVTQRDVVNELMTVTILPTTRRGRGFDPASVRIEVRR